MFIVCVCLMRSETKAAAAAATYSYDDGDHATIIYLIPRRGGENIIIKRKIGKHIFSREGGRLIFFEKCRLTFVPTLKPRCRAPTVQVDSNY